MRSRQIAHSRLSGVMFSQTDFTQRRTRDMRVGIVIFLWAIGASFLPTLRKKRRAPFVEGYHRL